MRDGSLPAEAAIPADEDPEAKWAGWGRQWTAVVFLALLSLTLNLAGNARTGLWDRDEPRYATAVREMRFRGDWIVPTFNGEPRYHKPILIYWLMRLSTAVAGDSPFGARLVSALAGAGSCLLVIFMGWKLLGQRVGLLAGLMLAVAPIMVAESKLATTDATLALLLVACQGCLLSLSRQASRFYAFSFWICLGMAFLTKGPIAPLLLAVSAAAAWWWGWPARLVAGRLEPRAGLALLAMVVAPWYLAIGLASHGEFFRFAVGTQIVQRVTIGMEEHGGAPGYYLALSTLAFYPWSVMMPAAVLAAWKVRRMEPSLAFLLGWVIGPWALLEVLPTRLLHYYLPSFPACALLVAWMVERIAAEDTTLRRWTLGRLAMGLLAGIGIAGTVGFLGGAILWPGPLRAPLAVLAMVLGLGTLLGMFSLHRGSTRQGVLGLSAAWALLALILAGWLVPAAEIYRTSPQVGRRLAALSASKGIAPVLLNYQEPGVIYAMGQPIATVRDRSDLDRLFEHQSSLLSVVTPEEHAAYRVKYQLEINLIETVEGLSLTKARNNQLEIVELRKRGDPRDGQESGSAIRMGSAEQPFVK